MIEFKQKLSSALAAAIAAKFPNAALTAGEIAAMLEYPPDTSMGDVALPCFKMSKSLRAGPPMIASAIAEVLNADLPDFIGSVAVAGGYLNFKVSDSYLVGKTLAAIENKDVVYGSSDVGKGKTCVLDYSSPNICKPFHIGHLGSTIIGHSLRNLYDFIGYDCVGINHLGDWGTQFGKQIVAYRRWGDRETIEKGGVDELVKIYVKFHEEAEKEPALNNEARAEFHKLEMGDEENVALWKWFVKISLEEFKKYYDMLGVSFDSFNGEAFYTDKMPAEVEKLRAAGLLKLDNGASIVDLAAYDMPPCLILKSDGSTLYPTRDIAAAVYRKNTYHFDKCIYVTSSQQCLHFKQWFKVVDLMGYDWADQLVHVPYGTVSINGEKLSTRNGNVILIKDLISAAVEKVTAVMEEKNPDLPDRDRVAEAVGVGAVVFNYLYNSRIKDINFILEDALSFDGNTGPYAQYTYARTCSILEKVKSFDNDAAKITASEEQALLLTLSEFPEKVLEAAYAYEPSIITRFVIEICTAFNRFYHECPILSAEDEEVRATRLRLTAATRTVLGSALRLICIKTPEKI